MLKRLFAALMAIATLVSCSIFANAQNDEPDFDGMLTEECLDTITVYPTSITPIDPLTVTEVDLDFSNTAQNSRTVMGNDNRTRVYNVTSSPYSSIAALYVIFPSSDPNTRIIGRGTGFMISDRYMLTAAHCIYDTDYGAATQVIAYFGREGASYSLRKAAVSWEYCTAYPGNPVTANDWAIIDLGTASVGAHTGHFNVAVVDDATLTNTVATIAGFPNDKRTKNDNFEDGYNRYMYEHSFIIGDVYPQTLRYLHDTYEGNSGSPIFTQSGGVGTVYGIHTYGHSTYNAGKRITSDLYNYWQSNGWVS